MQFDIQNFPVVLDWIVDFNFFCSFFLTCVTAEDIDFGIEN